MSNEENLKNKTELLDLFQKVIDDKTEQIFKLQNELTVRNNEISEIKNKFKETDEEIKHLKKVIDSQNYELNALKSSISYKLAKLYGKNFTNKHGPKAVSNTLFRIINDNKKDKTLPVEPPSDVEIPEIIEHNIPKQNIILSSDAQLQSDDKLTLVPPIDPDALKKLKTKLKIKFNHGESFDTDEKLIEMFFKFKSNMLDEWELACLSSCIKNFHWTSNDYIVEIGTNVGQTAIFMAKILQLMKLDNKIISIDPFSFAKDEVFNPKGNYFHYATTIQTENVNELCIPVTAYSQNISHIFKESIGLLLVDGSHRYEDAKKDLQYYCKLVKLNGYIFVDDYNVSSYPGVYRAFEEWLIEQPDFELAYKDNYFIIAKKIK